MSPSDPRRGTVPRDCIGWPERVERFNSVVDMVCIPVPLTSETCVVASHPAFPYLVPARRFLAWWQRLIELDAHLPAYMSKVEWLSRGQKIRSLLTDVGAVGR